MRLATRRDIRCSTWPPLWLLTGGPIQFSPCTNSPAKTSSELPYACFDHHSGSAERAAERAASTLQVGRHSLPVS
mgnify:CR=1 FL=1